MESLNLTESFLVDCHFEPWYFLLIYRLDSEKGANFLKAPKWLFDFKVYGRINTPNRIYCTNWS